jgi:hypothetical protein
MVSCCLSAFAGSVLACAKATRSKYGAYLVITTEIVQGKGASGNDELMRLEVYPWGEFDAYKGVTAPNTYREEGPEWAVSLRSGERFNLSSCPLPLVTVNGKFVVVLGSTFFGDSALRIYRRGSELSTEGVLVRQIELREIWPADKLPMDDKTKTYYDVGQPQWYTGGTFTFSVDSRTVTHTTRWGTTVDINLENGAVFRK